ncbi:hypothetical protein LZ30DRAFT_797150 [Colletotrichum cereale]|nr:hypothetical protein LZ30DRAFT_797150 [Colletotrichum cereale]
MEMATVNKQPEPPVLDRDGFQLGQDRRLTANGVDRVNGQKLVDLFHPERLRSRLDQDAIMAESSQLFTRPWLAAQLTYYGIEFPAKAAKGRLRDILERAVDSGECVVVPETVERIQQSMRNDYVVLFREWEAAKEDEAFAKCTTPVQKAACDLGRFMDHYFLTEGKPDRRKAPQPLALYGFTKHSALEALTYRVPGLQTARAKHSANICIGWDRFPREFLAGQAEAQIVPAKKLQRLAVWEDAMESHRRHVAQQVKGDGSKGEAAEKGTRRPFDVRRCQGSYVLRCKAADCYVEDDPEALLFTPDISASRNGLLVAAHNFGLFEGTMFLSLSEEKLKLLDELDDEEDLGEDPYDYARYGSDAEGRKDKWPSLAEKKKKKKKKKTKLTPSFSRRVYFRMRGRETGEGSVHHTSETGHLDFLSDLGTEFAGLAYEFPYVGSNVEFRGFKISDAPRKKPEPWGSFSLAASEYARTARW